MKEKTGEKKKSGQNPQENLKTHLGRRGMEKNQTKGKRKKNHRAKGGKNVEKWGSVLGSRQRDRKGRNVT